MPVFVTYAKRRRRPSPLPLVWSSDFVNGIDGSEWGPIALWGEENSSFSAESGISGQKMSCFMSEGSYGSYGSHGGPPGGTVFRSLLPDEYDVARLRYRLKFPADFEWALGGKLPGICGGQCSFGGASGLPDGTNGTSARLIWSGVLDGSIYAYTMDTVGPFGSSLATHDIPWLLGEWMTVEEEIRLGPPGGTGHIKVWLNGALIVTVTGLHFRTTSTVKIDAVSFSVFFGGDDVTWAATADTTIEFAEFRVYAA